MIRPGKGSAGATMRRAESFRAAFIDAQRPGPLGSPARALSRHLLTPPVEKGSRAR